MTTPTPPEVSAALSELEKRLRVLAVAISLPQRRNRKDELRWSQALTVDADDLATIRARIATLEARLAEQVQTTARIANEAAMLRLRAEAAEARLAEVEALPAKWRDEANGRTDTAYEDARVAEKLRCARQLDAALKEQP